MQRTVDVNELWGNERCRGNLDYYYDIEISCTLQHSVVVFRAEDKGAESVMVTKSNKHHDN